MAWDELTGSLDFTTLRALYAAGELAARGRRARGLPAHRRARRGSRLDPPRARGRRGGGGPARRPRVLAVGAALRPALRHQGQHRRAGPAVDHRRSRPRAALPRPPAPPCSACSTPAPSSSARPTWTSSPSAWSACAAPTAWRATPSMRRSCRAGRAPARAWRWARASSLRARQRCGGLRPRAGGLQQRGGREADAGPRQQHRGGRRRHGQVARDHLGVRAHRRRRHGRAAPDRRLRPRRPLLQDRGALLRSRHAAGPARFRFAVPRAGDLVFFGDARRGAAVRGRDRTAGRPRRQRASRSATPSFMEAQRLLYEAPFLAERNVSVEPMIAGHEDALHPATRTILAVGARLDGEDAYRAMHRLAELKRDARRLLAGTDVFVVPTTPTIYRVAEVEADPIRAQCPARHLHQLRQPDGPVRHRRAGGLPRATACRSASPCSPRPSPRPRPPLSPTPSTAPPASRSGRRARRIRGKGRPSRRYARNLAATAGSSANTHENPDCVGRRRHLHRQSRL